MSAWHIVLSAFDQFL